MSDIHFRYYINERNGDIYYTMRKHREIKIVDGVKFLKVYPVRSVRDVFINMDFLKEITETEYRDKLGADEWEM